MRIIFLSIIFHLCILSGFAHGQSVEVDQSYSPSFNNNFDFFQTRSGEGKSYVFGQEFIPSLAGLDFVDLFVRVNAISSIPMSFFVEIRDDTVDGPVLGMSSPLVYFQSQYTGEAHLTFPSLVPLMPGERYVIRAHVNFGHLADSVTIGVPQSGVGDGYGGGRWIYPSLPSSFTENRDVWFREGLTIVPEPGVWALLLLGGGVLVLSRKFRRAS